MERLNTPDHSPESYVSILKALNRYGQNPQGAPLTWGPTPMVRSAEVALQQRHVKPVIESFFEKRNRPKDISPEVAEYIEMIHMQRTLKREARNNDSYYFRGVNDFSKFPDEMIEMIQRAEKGKKISPAELLYLAQVLEVPSIELASLTHPYGARIEMLPVMREAARGGIVLHGGEVYEDPPVRFEVKNANDYSPEKMKAISMTRKTDLGELPDGTYVTERSSFVVILDKIPEAQAQAIRGINAGRDHKEYKWDPDQVLEYINHNGVMPEWLENDQFDVAVPIATTIVAFRGDLSEKLFKREAMTARYRETGMGTAAVSNAGIDL